MPWEIVQEDAACPADRPFGVHKTDDGELEGCHETYADADDQMSALYMAESEDAERAADDTFEPPQGVQDAAQRALDWIAEGLAGDGFTDVGRRRASQLANGEPVSRETVGRMANYFARHESDRDAEGFNSGEDGFPSPGRVAWDAWGGDAGRSWAFGILDAEDEERNGEESQFPLSPRQLAQYETTEAIVDTFGLFTQGIGSEGAHYVAESPFADEGMVCSSCVFYEGPRACEVVSGEIAPEGICKLWVIPVGLLSGVEDEPVQAPPVEDEETPTMGEMDGYERSGDDLEVPEREMRRVQKLELRMDDETGLPVVEGYATVYDYAYDIGDPETTGFTEVIARGAGAKTAKEGDIRLLLNHSGLPLARSKAGEGTMEVESDDIGLRISATLDPANPSAAEAISALQRGDLDQMSFAFRAVRQDYDSKANLRTVKEFKAFDVSLVTYPASAATVAKLRADDEDTDTADEKQSGRSVEQARRQASADRSRRRR